MKHYAERDPIALDKAGGYFTRHLAAMTAEGLHDKNAIAEELAHRDLEIDRLRADAERYRWRKENPAIEVDVFRGRYRCTTRDSVLTDWLDSYDEAIDAAMQGANY